MRYGRAPCELDELLTADEYMKLLGLANKTPRLFWGLGGL